MKCQLFHEKDKTIEDWQNLACYMLGRISLFNKRRNLERHCKITLLYQICCNKPELREEIEKFTIVGIDGKEGKGCLLH